jgi:hypothetical protein
MLCAPPQIISIDFFRVNFKIIETSGKQQKRFTEKNKFSKIIK